MQAKRMLLALVLVGGLARSGQTAQDVTIANPPTNPVNVRVTNTPLPVSLPTTVGVNASQVGTWTVAISGTPNVRVTNPATNPVLVKGVDLAGPREPFQISDSILMEDGDSGASKFVSVPAGKLLILETVSIDCFVPLGQNCSGYLTVYPTPTGGPTEVSHYLLFFEQPSTVNAKIFRASQSLRIYSHGSVGINMERGPDHSNLASVGFGLSGYLVDFP